MKRKFQNNNGFTLIEAMIVICIIAILIGAFGSTMIQDLPDSRFNSYVRNLQSAVQFARLAAVKSKADVILKFDKTVNTFSAFLDTNSNGAQDAGEPTIDAPTTPSGVVFTELFGTGLSQVDFVFDSRGVSKSKLTGDICMKNSREKHKGVRLTLAGNSRIIRSGDGGATWQ